MRVRTASKLNLVSVHAVKVDIPVPSPVATKCGEEVVRRESVKAEDSEAVVRKSGNEVVRSESVKAILRATERRARVGRERSGVV